MYIKGIGKYASGILLTAALMGCVIMPGQVRSETILSFRQIHSLTKLFENPGLVMVTDATKDQKVKSDLAAIAHNFFMFNVAKAIESNDPRYVRLGLQRLDIKMDTLLDEKPQTLTDNQLGILRGVKHVIERVMPPAS